MEDFLKFIAKVMEVDYSELTEDTTYGEFERWDSLMHLRMIMELEEEYGVEVPIDKIPKIKTLKELYEFTKQ